MIAVYVAAPYSTAPAVRQLHDALSQLGILPVSQWAEEAHSAERLSEMSQAERLGVFAANDAGVELSDFVVVLEIAGRGRAMFGEARYAIERGQPVVWCSVDPVSTPSADAFRPGVLRVAGIERVVRLMAELAGIVAAYRTIAASRSETPLVYAVQAFDALVLAQDDTEDAERAARAPGPPAAAAAEVGT